MFRITLSQTSRLDWLTSSLVVATYRRIRFRGNMVVDVPCRLVLRCHLLQVLRLVIMDVTFVLLFISCCPVDRYYLDLA